MKSQNVIKDVWKIMFPSAFFSYISFFIYSGFSVYTAKIMGRFVDLILANDYSSGKSMLQQIGIAICFNIFVMPLSELAVNMLYFKGTLKHEKLIVHQFFLKKYSKMKKFSIGELSSRLEQDAFLFKQSVVLMPMKCSANITVIIITSILMLKIHFIISAIILFLIFASLIFTFAFAKRISSYAAQLKFYKEDLQSDLIDLIENRAIFHSYGMQIAFIYRFSVKFKHYYENTFKKENRLTNWITFGRELILLSCVGMLLIISTIYLKKEDITTGEIVTLYYYMLSVKSMTSQVASYLKDFSQTKDNIKRLKELISDSEEEMRGDRVPDKWETLVSEKLQFQYSSDKEIFSSLSFEIKQNELIHLVGDNGAGKSTLINLICGLYPANGGSIKIGDRDMKNYNIIAWRDKLAIMNQFPDVFPGTLFENVHIAKLDATTEQVKQVIAYVGLDSMSNRALTGNSDELSGGEQKRLSVARMMIRDAPIIILDEPYENLDTTGKLLIDELLQTANKTRIFVAHNLQDTLTKKRTIQL